MNLYKFFLTIFRLSPLLFLVNLLSISLMAATETLAILSLAPIVDSLTSIAASSSEITSKIDAILRYLSLPTELLTYILLFLALMILKSGMGLLYRYVALKTKYYFLERFMVESFGEFLNGGLPFFNSEKQGVLLNTFNSEIVTVGNSLSMMSLFLSNLIHIAFYLCIPLTISWELTLISIFAFFIVALPSKLIDRLSYRKGEDTIKSANSLSTILQETFSSVKVVLAFGNREETLRKYQNIFDNHKKDAINFQLVGHYLIALYEPLLLLILFGVLWLAQSYFKIPISEIIIMLYAFKTIMPLVITTIKDKNSINGFIPSYEQIKRLTEKAKLLAVKSGDKIFSTLKKEIEFKNVYFSYHGNEVLKGVNFSFSKGEKIALVGQSGSGKTTIVDLILGLYVPVSGEIFIDGQSLKNIDVDSFRSRIGYVPQDPILFNTTLRENLFWSLNSGQVMNDEELIEILKLSNSWDFVKKMPSCLDTIIGDRGAKLSGGERQRIALTRALVRKPDLLILDEATSALDNQSERLIQDSVNNLGRETTVIMIAHRLSTIKNADKIYYIEEGKVEESGTYEELLLKDGKFKKLASNLH